jgi:hypothetical protein
MSRHESLWKIVKEAADPHQERSSEQAVRKGKGGKRNKNTKLETRTSTWITEKGR